MSRRRSDSDSKLDIDIIDVDSRRTEVTSECIRAVFDTDAVRTNRRGRPGPGKNGSVLAA